MRLWHLLTIPLLVAGLYGSAALAQVMQSTSYRIQDDSVNFGGGYGSSTSLLLESTYGEVATGISSSTNYVMNAGYQQMHETYLALSGVSDVTMAPSLGGITGGTSDGAVSITATTDSYSGYIMTIAASNSPAMQSGSATIADYAPAGSDPDYNFTVAASQSLFGFSPEGIHIPTRFKDNGSSACNTGSSDTSLKCWAGLTTAAQTIAQSASANHPSGTATTLRFRVGIGGSSTQLEGVYVATTTVTLLAQ